MEFITKNKGIFIGAMLGMITGYLYWHFIGCVSGTCAITSNPINSTLFGALFGGMFGNNFKKEKEEKPVPPVSTSSEN